MTLVALTMMLVMVAMLMLMLLLSMMTRKMTAITIDRKNDGMHGNDSGNGNDDDNFELIAIVSITCYSWYLQS